MHCFHFSISRYLNIAILAYIALAPYLVAEIAGGRPSFVWFILSCAFVVIVLAALNYVIDRYLLEPLAHMSSTIKVIVSTSVFFLIFTMISVFWPSGILLDNPLGTHSLSLLSTDFAYIDLITIALALSLVAGLAIWLRRSTTGQRVRAFADDPIVSCAYGISRELIRISVSVITGILTTVAGVALASPGSPRAGTTSVIFFAMVALSVVIIARHRDLRVCLIASLVIAGAQTLSARYVTQINRGAIDVLSAIGVDSHLQLGPTFADRFIPFTLALAGLALIPEKWIRGVDHG